MISTKRMLLSFELIKQGIKAEGESSEIAQGKYHLSKIRSILFKVFRISVNVGFWIFISYLIFF